MTVLVDITQEAHEYMWACIMNTNAEVGGIGYIERQEDGGLLWHKTLLTPQEVTTGSIDFTDDFYMVEQAHRDGVLGNENFVWVWWHSHYTMGVFWSDTDKDEYIAKFRDAGAPSLISLVGNHAGNVKMRLDIFDHPLAGHITLEDVALNVQQDPSLMALVKDDLAKFVKAKPLPPKKGTSLVPSGKSTQEQLDDAEWDDIAGQCGMDTPLSPADREMLKQAFSDEHKPHELDRLPGDMPLAVDASNAEWDAFMLSDADSWQQWCEAKAEAAAVQG